MIGTVFGCLCHLGSPSRRGNLSAGFLRCHVLWIIVLLKGISGLRLLEMSAPSAAILGRGMWLNCSFDLESDELYSVKWYKNDTEFYRYHPRDRQPAQSYDLPGVIVDMSRSREGHVFVPVVNLSSEGNYRCEASAEAPYFQTVAGEKEVKVFVIPEKRPTIRGTRTKYNVGDRVEVSCRAPYSLPAAKLVWLVNGREVPLTEVRDLETLYDSDGLQSSAAALSFIVRPHHLAGSTFRLKCISVISEVSLISSEELIVGDTVPSIPYPDTTPDSPIIEGGKSRYRINDIVNVTCRSAEYDGPPEVKWFINNKEARLEYLVHHPLQRSPRFSAILGLKFQVRPEHFEEDRMHLRCTVTLPHVLNTSSAEAVIKNRQRTTSGLMAPSEDASNTAIARRPPFLLVLLIAPVLLKI